MTAVATAIIGSAVIGGAVSYFGNEAKIESAEKAAEIAAESSAENIALQKELSEIQREDFQPWREVGANALSKIEAGIESGEFDPGVFDPSQIDVTADPGYQFRMKQGVEALDSSAAARGRLLSGAQDKALTKYGQEMGSQEYNNAYARYADQYSKEANRKANKFNMLNMLSTGGQASAAKQAQATGQLGTQSSNIMQNLSNQQQQAEYNKGNASANMYGNMAQSANQGAQNWLLYKNLGG